MKPILLAVLCLTGVPAGAQQPVEKPPASPAAAQPATATAGPAPVSEPGYVYTPAGRRDPFVSLAGRGADPKATGNRAPGLPGMLINEVSLKGIMKDRSGFVAMLQGTDKKTYVVRSGNRLLDGSVKTISADAVVFAQDVNDPLSLVKQREVRKTLRAGEEIRE